MLAYLVKINELMLLSVAHNFGVVSYLELKNILVTITSIIKHSTRSHLA